MKNLILGLGAIGFALCGWSQEPTDYLGAGRIGGIQVTSSGAQNPAQSGASTVDGFQVNDPELLADASRFLSQASMGYDYNDIELVAAMGAEAWLDEQLKLPRTDMLGLIARINAAIPRRQPESLWGMYQFRTAWWNLVLKGPDLLRQRTAFALSQIFVVSGFGSDFFEDEELLSASYYNLLTEHAFGNYRDLLRAVSLSPSMGIYLSHLNNPKSDPANNIHPDENYAREVMQLFSIGLYELNLDGTRQVDSLGNFIPTYTNDDIKEFAKIFTGLGDGHPQGIFGEETFGGEDEEHLDRSMLYPMKMYESWHEKGEKRLLYGQVVPAGQSAMDDFEDAIDNLFYHPNVGPFIGTALIRFLTSSNPSPAYVARVAGKFNDNGNGVRGDLKAVLKAILLDPEARDCAPQNQIFGGRLREPLVRYTQFLRAFHAYPDETNLHLFITMMDAWQENTGQTPMYASSVFNFFQPGFQPNGPIADWDLVAPEFQIHNSSTSLGFINAVNQWTFRQDVLPASNEDADEEYEEPEEGEESSFDEAPDLDRNFDLPGVTRLHPRRARALVHDPAALVDHLNLLLACGQLTERSQGIIERAVGQLEGDQERLFMAMYLVMIAPEYAVLK